MDADFARYYWPNGKAVGGRLFQGSQRGRESDAFTVVGVVGSVKQAGLADETAQGAIYYPYLFRADNGIFVVVRSLRAPDSLAPAVEKTVRGIDPDLPVANLQSMDDRISSSLLMRRSPALLAAVFAAIALLLTVIGTYGVLSYAVAGQRREIGIRIALGARPAQIRRQFLWMAARLLIAGTLLGAAGAWMAGRAMRSVLFHIASVPPPVLGIAAGVITSVSLAACLLPARRAARVSPLETLTSQ